MLTVADPKALVRRLIDEVMNGCRRARALTRGEYEAGLSYGASPPSTPRVGDR